MLTHHDRHEHGERTLWYTENVASTAWGRRVPGAPGAGGVLVCAGKGGCHHAFSPCIIQTGAYLEPKEA
jgi:hypothetical protein